MREKIACLINTALEELDVIDLRANENAETQLEVVEETQMEEIGEPSPKKVNHTYLVAFAHLTPFSEEESMDRLCWVGWRRSRMC